MIDTESAAPEADENTAPKAPAKKRAVRKTAATGDNATAPAKKRASRKAADGTGELPLGETAAAPQPQHVSPAPPAPTAPTQPRAVLVPTIHVVEEKTTPSPSASANTTSEAIIFDPTKIMEKFTPPVSAPPPSPPPITTDSVAAEVAAAPPIVVEESGKIVPPPSAPTAPTAPSAQQSYSGGKQHPDQRRFQSNGNGGGQGKQHSHGNNPQTAPAQQSQHQHNNNNNNQRKNGPPQQHQSGNPNHNQGGGKKDKFRNKNQQPKHWPGLASGESVDERTLALGTAFDYETLNAVGALDELIAEAVALTGEPFIFNDSYALPVNELVAIGKTLGYRWQRLPPRRVMVADLLAAAYDQGRPIHIRGTLELLEDGNGLLVYLFDNYRVRELSAFVPRVLIKQYGLLRGHELDALALPAHEGETAPVVVRIDKVMGEDPEIVAGWTPFTELTPYYPTKRMLLETDNNVTWDNLSMRCVDLLCPVGLGQRGLIVAPPRTGKTVLLQGIANSIVQNTPAAHLIILLVDERPEEVTDFRRQVKQAEIVSSTFDESAESHVHAAEMVIERARRMVEAGRHVVILLDSITRLARAYNTMMPSTGKILSGGVESNALSKPKRFFGSARNIEGGGSLTILGTALVDTGSKMDEVIFEEFKGTGNMELDLDRDLANKRIFPAISFERSGTRKEELLYHPDEMQKVYSLRRAMKGVPSVEAMEQLIHRIKKTKTNIEFLVTLAR